MINQLEIQDEELQSVISALLISGQDIYNEVKSGNGLDFLKNTNESGDDQLELDVIADECFQKHISEKTNVRFILSEERPKLVEYGTGPYSIALDPLDGSKSALVGIPSGAIFCVFNQPQNISDFNGQNVVSGGFFVFGINLEVYLSLKGKAFKGLWKSNSWSFIPLQKMPHKKMFAINVSNLSKWDKWLQNHYTTLVNKEGADGKSFNIRWYASMVSEVKRLILQGGIFSYPSDSREGYSNGHLRLVYEAIPMAYLIESIGGASTNGDMSILNVQVHEHHQKTAVFLGEKQLITDIEKSKN